MENKDHSGWKHAHQPIFLFLKADIVILEEVIVGITTATLIGFKLYSGHNTGRGIVKDVSMSGHLLASQLRIREHWKVPNGMFVDFDRVNTYSTTPTERGNLILVAGEHSDLNVEKVNKYYNRLKKYATDNWMLIQLNINGPTMIASGMMVFHWSV